jgi:hypothetical protein
MMEGNDILIGGKLIEPYELNINYLKFGFSEIQSKAPSNKYMRKCSTSLEMQIKVTLRFCLTPVRTATIKNTNNKFGKDLGRGTTVHYWHS